jgi:predicted nucleic acid-binding protein
MAVLFLDSSALVKRYRDELGSDRVAELIARSDRQVVARLTHVEVSSAIIRRARAARMDWHQVAAILDALDHDVSDRMDIVDLDAPVLDRAVALARRHALRGADAIQLACALLAWNDLAGREFLLVASDVELNAAATAEGLRVVDPTG